jgi:hypothetical protein
VNYLLSLAYLHLCVCPWNVLDDEPMKYSFKASWNVLDDLDDVLDDEPMKTCSTITLDIFF